MRTSSQNTGDAGERLVRKHIDCPRCKRATRSLRVLPPNFRCADLICDFCGYLAQVKTVRRAIDLPLPSSILGAAWSAQRERMRAGIFFPLFIVIYESATKHAINYLSADLQSLEMFAARKPLSSRAHRPGWRGFRYDLKSVVDNAIVRLYPLERASPRRQRDREE